MFILIDGQEVTAEEITKMHEEDRLAVVSSGNGITLMFLYDPFDEGYAQFWKEKGLDIKRPLDLSAALFAASV